MSSILRCGKLLHCIPRFSRNFVNSIWDREVVSVLNTNVTIQIPSVFLRGFNDNNNSAALRSDSNLERQLRRLDNDVRRMGRISRRNLDDVLDEIRTQRTVTSSQSLMLIRYCGNLVPEELPEVRTILVQNIWKTFTSLNVPMDISHYNALLRVYLENEHSFSPSEFLAEIESKSIEPNRVTYQRLIARYCQLGNIDGATQILEHMHKKNIAVSEAVFNSLILGHSQANDLESAKGIMSVMRQAGLEPSADTYTTLLCCYAKYGDLKAIETTLVECDNKDVILLDKDILNVIYELTVNGYSDKLDICLSKLHYSTGFNQDCVNTILRLTNHGYEDVCLKLLKLMPRGKRYNGESIDVGTFFIRQMVKSKRPLQNILNICKILQDEYLHSNPLLIATEASLTYGINENSLPLLKEMMNVGLPIRQHYFWPIFCSAKSNEIMDILRKMQKEFNLQPSVETLREYVIPNLQEKQWSCILTLLRDSGIPSGTAASATAGAFLVNHKINEAADIMETYRAYYSFQAFRLPLMHAFAKTHNYDAFTRCVRQLFESVHNYITKAGYSTHGKEENEIDVVINENRKDNIPDVVGELLLDVYAYFHNDRVNILEKLLPKFVQEGFTISNAHANCLTEKLGSSMTHNISLLLDELSSGKLEITPLNKLDRRRNFNYLSGEELERIIMNKETKGENVNNLKQNLLNASIRSKNLEKVLEVMERLEAENFTISSGFKAQLIDLYCFHKKFSDALATYNKIKSEDSNFCLDHLKTINLIELLLQNDQFDQAIDFLERNANTNIEIETNYTYASKVWRILNILADSGDCHKIQKLFDALVSGNYIVPNNVFLGPLIKVHLIKNDLPSAIETFEKLCEEYRVTPWKNELARRLIEAEDATNLQRITDLSTNIHGEINSLYDLVFSFIECGRIRQARKILETPGLRTRPHRIDNACERYINEGKTESLEGLVEATKDLNHIDRNKIFYTLLLSYCKSNEIGKAVGLWTKMQDECVVPNDSFLLKLAELLQANNMSVPFIIPKIVETQPKTNKENLKSNIEHNKKTSLTISNISHFRKLLHAANIDAALDIKNNIQSDELTIVDLSLLIEQLVRANRIDKATEYVKELLARNCLPSTRVFKFYLNTLCNNGDINTLESISQQLTDEQKRFYSFDNRLCQAIIVGGNIEQYLQNLIDEIIAVKSADEAEKLAVKFPLGGVFGILEKHTKFLPKYQKLAELYAQYEKMGPMNILWIHFLCSGDDVNAKIIWDKYLCNLPRIMFKRIIRKAREENSHKLIEKLIDQLRESKVSEGAFGSVYSYLINIHTVKGNIDEALEILNTAIKDVCLENINKNVLRRLKSSFEAQKKEFPYVISDKGKLMGTSDSSNQSTDDDISLKEGCSTCTYDNEHQKIEKEKIHE